MERYDSKSINMEIRDIDKRMEEINKFLSLNWDKPSAEDKYRIVRLESGHIKVADLLREKNDLINRKDVLNLKLAIYALQDK